MSAEESPAEPGMQGTCEKCGTSWTANEFLPCPTCTPDLKQKLLKVWGNNFHWLDNEKFVSEVCTIVCEQHAALEKVSTNKTQTVFSREEEFMNGAHVAFGQSAELADAALANVVEAAKKLSEKVERYASNGCIEGYSNEGGLGDVWDEQVAALSALDEALKGCEV